MGVNSLLKTVTRQRRGCDLNPALLRLSPARYLLGYRCAYCCIIGQIKMMMIYIFISPKYGSSSMMCRNV